MGTKPYAEWTTVVTRDDDDRMSNCPTLAAEHVGSTISQAATEGIWTHCQPQWAGAEDQGLRHGACRRALERPTGIRCTCWQALLPARPLAHAGKPTKGHLHLQENQVLTSLCECKDACAARENCNTINFRPGFCQLLECALCNDGACEYSFAYNIEVHTRLRQPNEWCSTLASAFMPVAGECRAGCGFDCARLRRSPRKVEALAWAAYSHSGLWESTAGVGGPGRWPRQDGSFPGSFPSKMISQLNLNSMPIDRPWTFLPPGGACCPPSQGRRPVQSSPPSPTSVPRLTRAHARPNARLPGHPRVTQSTTCQGSAVSTCYAGAAFLRTALWRLSTQVREWRQCGTRGTPRE